MFGVALIAVAGLIAAAVQLTKGPDLRHVSAGLRWPLPYVQSAARWAKARGLPLEWVLATIIVESRGNPRAVGDDGRSIGLMQVNAAAHASELAAEGASRDALFDPNTNIAWGTRYLRQFRDDVKAAAAGRSLPAALDVLVRLAYKGPAPVTSALRHGANPLALSWAPGAVANWQAAMARVTALTRGAPRV
jgi:soluble lytic murein transglycosylase-like protein